MENHNRLMTDNMTPPEENPEEVVVTTAEEWAALEALRIEERTAREQQDQ